MRQACLLAIGVLSQQASPQVLPEVAVSRAVDQQAEAVQHQLHQQVGGKDNRQDGSRQVGRQQQPPDVAQEKAELQVSTPFIHLCSGGPSNKSPGDHVQNLPDLSHHPKPPGASQETHLRRLHPLPLLLPPAGGWMLFCWWLYALLEPIGCCPGGGWMLSWRRLNAVLEAVGCCPGGGWVMSWRQLNAGLLFWSLMVSGFRFGVC